MNKLEVFLSVVLLFGSASIGLCRCGPDKGRATSALQTAGYTEIDVRGLSLGLNCSDDDMYITPFKAKGPTGVAAHGHVCCGIFKNCTIRLGD